MPTPKVDKKRVEIDLPPAHLAKYGQTVAAIMDQIADSEAPLAKGRKPEEFRWYLQYVRADDPPTKDYGAFLRHLRDHSEVWLVARGFHCKREQKLGVPPDQVMSRFESHARLICSQRQHAEEMAIEEPTDLEPKATATAAARPSSEEHSLFKALMAYLSRNPEADPAMAEIAKIAVSALVKREIGY